MTPARKQTPKAEAERPLDQVAQLFDLLSDPTRLRIVLLLDQEGEATVTGLCHELGISQSAVSTQLMKLRLVRLVEMRRDGHFAHFRLTSDAACDLLRLGCRLVEGDADKR